MANYRIEISGFLFYYILYLLVTIFFVAKALFAVYQGIIAIGIFIIYIVSYLFSIFLIKHKEG